jgi:Na+-translocating ferredoxin:NAD+ oxidoreductase RnfE subunit
MKKTNDKIGLPIWLMIIYFIIEIAVISIIAYRFNSGSITLLGLTVGLIAVFCIADIFRCVNQQEISENYEDKIDELESKVNIIDRENSELRTIMKNSQRIKTKKND